MNNYERNAKIWIINNDIDASEIKIKSLAMEMEQNYRYAQNEHANAVMACDRDVSDECVWVMDARNAIMNCNGGG